MSSAATGAGSSGAEGAGSHLTFIDANVYAAAVDQASFELIGRGVGKTSNGNREAATRSQCTPDLQEASCRARPQLEGVHGHGLVEGSVIEGKPVSSAEVEFNRPGLDLSTVLAMRHGEHRLRRLDAHKPSFVSSRSGKLQADPRFGAHLCGVSCEVYEED